MTAARPQFSFAPPCQARHFASRGPTCRCAPFYFCDLHALGRDLRPARLAAGHAPKGLTDTAPTFKPQKKTIHAHAPRPFGEISRLSASSAGRSEEHTSELQSLMRISYAVFCLKKTNTENLPESYAIS